MALSPWPLWTIACHDYSSANSSLLVSCACPPAYLGPHWASTPFFHLFFEANLQSFLLPETFPAMPVTLISLSLVSPGKCAFFRWTFFFYFLHLELFGTFIISSPMYPSRQRKDRAHLCPRGGHLSQLPIAPWSP